MPRIISVAANNYIMGLKRTLKNLLSSSYIHADETKISIRGETQYVWVFTNGKDVLLELTKTREADIVHRHLEGYSGILISDFYGGYDAVNCIQQKCLVHLIRDINEDLWKSPFDHEFEQFVFAFKNLITPILRTVDEIGSNIEALQPFLESVEHFYDNTINKRYISEPAKKYQKRFIRYKTSLFTFLEHNNTPWNNNMAERAIRHLAIQRKISGSFSEKGAADYIALLSLAQTCRFQDKSFLRFLLSQKEHPDDYEL